MALAGELAKYVGNEMIKTGGKELAKAGAKSALSSLVPNVATKAGTSLLNQATALGLSKNNNKWILNTSILDTDEGVGKIKDFMNPILGGGKTPNYQRFLEQIGEGEYQMGHRPNLYVGDSETKFPLSNMEADPDYLPKIYGDNEASTVRNLLMLGNTGPDAQRSAKIIAQYQNQPDKMVKIFRQAPKDMNYGDWVGLTKEYADNHIGNSPNNQLWEREVPASEVMFAGDDINEWGYYPKQVQLDDDIANELNRAIEMSGADMSVAKRADSYLGGRMLDKNGKPMTFYHSTPNEFSKFDDARLGENTGYENTALGHFVTTDKDFSKRFIDIDNTGKTGRTMELQAKIQKPITHPYMAGQKYDEKELDKIVEDYLIATNNQDSLESLRELAEEDGTSLYDAYMDLTFGGDSPFEYSADDRKALLDNGYDAVEIVEGPKSSLVDGSNDDSVVSSYAVLNGDNLAPVRHIPVQQDNYVPLYHQTSANSLADFSLDKRSAGVSDATMPEGIFLKETNADIGLPGKNQLQLDAKLNNPLRVMNRDDLKAKLMAMNPKVAKYLRAENDIDNLYEKLSEEAQTAVDKAYEKMYYDKSDANKKSFAEATEKMKGIIPEWREKIRENAATSQKEIKKLLKENGYDGMIMDEDRGSFGRKVKSYLVLDKEQLRDNSVPVKFNKSSSKNLEPATKLGKDLNSVAEAMREYKAKNMKKMADNMIDGYSNEIFDWAALRKKGEKSIEKIVGKDGLKNLKTFVEPVVNNTSKAGEYEVNKTIATNFLKNADSDKIIEASRELLPPGTKIYRRGSKSGISWTTDEALAKSSKYDGELIEHILTKDDRYIAPQFIDILQRTIENENQVLFKLK